MHVVISTFKCLNSYLTIVFHQIRARFTLRSEFTSIGVMGRTSSGRREVSRPQFQSITKKVPYSR